MEKERRSSQQYGALDEHGATEKPNRWRYFMMDDIQLCKEITRLKQELQKLVTTPDKDKSAEDGEKEEELLKQINKLVETRDFLVDDVEFERLREREEDKEMAAFLESKFPSSLAEKGALRDRRVASQSQQTSSPFLTKAGLTLLKDCCGFTCSVICYTDSHMTSKQPLRGAVTALTHSVLHFGESSSSGGGGGSGSSSSGGPETSALRWTLSPSTIMEFLLGNPFSSPVGQLIDLVRFTTEGETRT
ncbi:hypothetical protein CCH79_00014732 [Gambusia affinis]|uniref:BMERB domain-containing protein n=1 Tax=Gambusia affinis TaxID=33528 RepID=A0A315V956_GAMAF|nr:hypothetical protein CCH79_00014732 [Gambusia affinis]